jgi:hypothetical protein
MMNDELINATKKEGLMSKDEAGISKGRVCFSFE